jgi:hypothetical protein
MAENEPLVFINYRGSDENWAIELVHARMAEAFGADAVFKAGNSIRAGEAFPPILKRQAASCPVMLACIGPGWLTAVGPDGHRRLDRPDDWVRREIAISLQSGNQVIPLLLGNHDEVAVPDPALLPEEIRSLVEHQAWRLAPGGGLDRTVPPLVSRLVELVPELGRRRTALGDHRSAQPPVGTGDTYEMNNTASGNGTVNAVQHGNQTVDMSDTP